MTKTYRLLALLLACMMMLAIAPRTAEAQGDVHITVTVNPTELVGPGNVVLTAKIENKTGKEISNVKLIHGGMGSPSLKSWDGVAADGSVTYTNNAFFVSESMLGHTQNLLITWQAEDAEGTLQDYSKQTGFTVGKAAPVVSVNASFNVDVTTVNLGENVTLSFTVENNGNVPLTEVSIQYTDQYGIHYVPLQSEHTNIEAGGSIEVTETVAVQEDFTFSPVLYYVADGESREMKLGEKQVTVTSDPLIVRAETSVTEPVEKGDTVPFTVYVENPNDYAIEGVKITDELGNVVRESATIAAKSTAKITFRAQAEESRGIQFVAKYILADKEMTATSEPIPITVKEELQETPAPEKGKLSLSVVANPAETEFPANITFQITVHNEGNVPLYDIVVFEETLGDVGNLKELAAGSRTITYTIEVKEAGSFVFGVSARDGKGQAYAEQIAPIAVREPSATVQPTATPERTPASGKPDESDPFGTVMTIILVLVVLVALAAVAMIILMLQEKRKQEAKREAERRARREAQAAEQALLYGGAAAAAEDDVTRVIPPVVTPAAEEEATREIPTSSVHARLEQEEAAPTQDEKEDDDFTPGGYIPYRRSGRKRR